MRSLTNIFFMVSKFPFEIDAEGLALDALFRVAFMNASFHVLWSASIWVMRLVRLDPINQQLGIGVVKSILFRPAVPFRALVGESWPFIVQRHSPADRGCRPAPPGAKVVVIIAGLGQVYWSRYGSGDKSAAFNRSKQSLIRFRSRIRSNPLTLRPSRFTIQTANDVKPLACPLVSGVLRIY
jgi:hypothetical protein